MIRFRSFFHPPFDAFWRRCLFIFVLVVPLQPAVAQDAEQQRLVRTWEDTARRAEDALQSGQASSDAFEVLRVELADQRAQAEAMADAGRITIRSLKAQIEALGPAPGKDQTEPPPIAG